jgi:hypothetical protein
MNSSAGDAPYIQFILNRISQASAIWLEKRLSHGLKGDIIRDIHL